MKVREPVDLTHLWAIPITVDAGSIDPRSKQIREGTGVRFADLGSPITGG
jgi:hypothetical protein